MNYRGENAPEAELLEVASAAKLRGLSARLDWPEIEARARDLAVDARQNAVELASAARALDAVAQGAPGGGALARERGLWASAAFAAGGNFPAASVVIARTCPRARAADGATAALLCALSPALRFALRAQTPLAAALDALFAGETCEITAVWDSIENASFAPALWDLARRALQATRDAVTVRASRDVTPGAVASGAASSGAVAFADCASGVASSGAASSGALALPDGFLASLSARVPTLLPPQLDAIRGGLLGGENALVALPPGTGKTLLGELFLASSLGRNAGLAVFLVPYVALGRGVCATLRAHLPAPIPVHRWLGGQGASGENGEKCRAGERAEFAVATPERFDALLRARPELWNQLRGVVIDEAHTLGQGARGVRVEGLIARLRAHQNRGAKTRLLLLSAALDERDELADWAGARRVFASNWTPTARRLAFWRQDGVLEWHAELADGSTRALGELAQPWPHHINNGGDGWARVRRLEPLAWRNVAALAQQLHEERGGAILCLCATRRATREIAGVLGELFPETLEIGGALARCIESIEARHRTLLPLARLLRRRVAWHNSSLPFEVRDALEDAIADGQIHAVAATSTLAEGVDLPFAQTIVADWLSWSDAGQTPLSSALFRNIAGRCGRAGRFTEGDTLVFDNPLGPAQFTAPAVRRDVQRRAFVGAVLGEPRSALIGHNSDANAGANAGANAHTNISAGAGAGADADADANASAGAKVSANANVGGARTSIEAALESQLLALALEQPQLAVEPSARAFYAARFDDDFAARVAQIRANFEREGLIENGVLSALGAAIARTDWSPASALRLLGALQALPAQDFEGARGAARLNAYLWRALGALPEAGGEIERFFRARSRLAVRPEALEELGQLWLGGVAPEAIFASLPRAANLPGLSAWLERDEAPVGAESAVPEWSGEFDRYLDWQRAGLETWTPYLWRAAGLLAPLAGPRAARVRWNAWARRFELGVDSAWAARALALGAPGTRTTCAPVGRYWPFRPAEPARDGLALAPLSEEAGRAQAHAALDAALREAGGAYCLAGRNVLALRDWLWARAGLTK